MKRLLLIILLIFPLSCYDGLSDMLDDLTMKVPICVDASAAFGGDGRGWRNAFQTLQDAVAAARPGDDIWVAGSQNITSTITIDKPLSLYGGFSGRESRRDQRDVDSRTVVSNTGAAEAIRITSKNVVFDTFRIDNAGDELGAITIDSGSSAVFENCIFSGNTNNNEPGGAISISNAVVKISNSQFYENSSLNGGGAIYVTGAEASLTIQGAIFGDKDVVLSGNTGVGSGGGAIHAAGGATVTVTDNTKFYRNNTSMGGAIYVIGSGTTLNVKDAVFGDKDAAGSGNWAGNGGAIYAAGGSRVTVTDNTQFYRNSKNESGNPIGNDGGAIYVIGAGTTLVVQGSIFGDKDTAGSGNGVNNQGGAIYASGGSIVKISENTQFYRNTAEIDGGAIYLSASTFDVTNSIFGGDSSASGNKTTSSTAGNGGAIHVFNSDVTLSGTKIKYNSSYRSGGMFSNGGTVDITDSYIQNNTSLDSGGGFRAFNCPVVINNSEISGNSTGAGSGGGGILFNSPSAANINLDIKNSRFFGNSAGSGGGGAISFSPVAVNVILIIERTVFDSNSATGAGGAIMFSAGGSGCKILMESCIVRNTPTDNGSAVFVSYGTHSQFVNSLFYNNRYTASSTAYGGSLSLNSSSLLVNLTFFNNSANNGGAVYLSGSPYHMYNTVFYNNTSTNGGATNTLNTNSGVTLNRYNCVYNDMSVSAGGVVSGGTTGNTTDPFLNSSDPSSSNFMRPGSLLVDAGYTGAISGFTMPLTDLAGNTRIRGGAIDIGAYERQ